MTSLSPDTPRRSARSTTRVRVRADEAVINQWLLDQTTPARRPAALLALTEPVSGEPVPVEFKQSIGERDPLRTGRYSKTLTFTLSSTTP